MHFVKTDSRHLVTKNMSEVNFVSPVMNGDIIEFGCDLLGIGNTSISVKLEVRNKTTKKKVVEVDKITFVNLDKFGIFKKIGT